MGVHQKIFEVQRPAHFRKITFQIIDFTEMYCPFSFLFPFSFFSFSYFLNDFKVSEWDNSWKIWIDQTEIETLTLKKSHFQSGPRNIHSNFPLMYFKVIKKISFIWCKKVLFTICFRHYFLILCSLYWKWNDSLSKFYDSVESTEEMLF
jgi:hypothetical protein